MITCLNNLIGVRGLAGYENPDSGRFITDLEGITLEKLEDISDQTDHYEPRLAYEDMLSRTEMLLESDVKSRLRKYMRNYSEDFNGITSQVDELEALTQSAVYNGWYFDIGTKEPNRALTFDTFTIYLAADASFDLFVFDASTGEQLFKETYAGTQGLNTYRILKTYPAWKYRDLFVCYDASQISTVRTDRYVQSIGAVSAQQVDKNNAVLTTAMNGTDTGLILNYSWSCSVDNFVCQRVDLFTPAVLYKLGIEFTKEVLHSDRINRYTLLDRERARELHDSFMDQYDEIMDSIFRDIKVSSDSCFECAKGYMYKMSTP